MTPREAELLRENESLKDQLAEAQRQIAMLVRHVFGRKTEQSPPHPDQTELTLEIEAAAIGSEPVPPTRPKRGSRKGRRVRNDLWPAGLPVEETVLVPACVQRAPDNWRRIGEDVAERLEREPARMVIQRIVRPRYVRRDQPHAAPVQQPAPPRLIEGGMLGDHLMVDLVIGKYLHHQPLDRQARALKWECGVNLSAATLCQTIARLAHAAAPIVRHIAAGMWAGPVVQADLTPVRCLSRGHKGGSFLGQMWVMNTPGGDVVYHWERSKEAIVAERLVPPGWKGVLQTDGGSEFACYLKGGKARGRPPDIMRAGCWAHVRRKFHEASRAGCRESTRLLKIINVLYRIEGVIRESGSVERAAVRHLRSGRVIRGLRRRMDTVVARERPRKPVVKACLYAIGQWESLLVYLGNGAVPIDNNSVENAIRPCALGKKNYLFIGDVRAGSRSAVFYSLLGTCLRRGINPREYLRWLFERLATTHPRDHRELVPGAYAAQQRSSTVQAAA